MGDLAEFMGDMPSSFMGDKPSSFMGDIVDRVSVIDTPSPDS